jgi:hypothetical protein
MNKLPNIVRARLSAVEAGDHPDPDLLTAFAEQALAEQERSKVLAHLSRCCDCREVLAVAMPSLASAALATASSIDTGRRRSWFSGLAVRWGVAAACVVIVGSAVLMKRDVLMKPAARTAALQQDQALTYSSDKANKKDFTVLPEPQPPSPSALVRDEERATGALSSSTRMQAQLSTRMQDQKKALTSNLMLPAAPPSLPGRMRPELAQSPTGGGIGGAASVGSLASTPKPNATPANESLNLPSSNGRNIATPPAPSKPAIQITQEVQVTAAAPVMEADMAEAREKQELPGKAKAPSGVTTYDAFAAPSQDSNGQMVTTKEAARKAEMKRVETLRPPVARWTISSDGQLQHSIDSGKTWQPVVVAENATFRALSANGPDLWVGGASGLLYHSTDAGAHWTQVKPATADATLTADIAAIEFIDVHQGKITTSTGEVWITTDGGQSWRKQS